MPDFHKTLPIFSGTENQTEAVSWIRNINSTAEMHNWPTLFKFEIVRTKLEGPAHNWYMERIFVDWTAF